MGLDPAQQHRTGRGFALRDGEGARLALARDAQSRGDLRDADAQVLQVLKADPKNGEAIAFKQKNDQMIAALKGRMPDAATMEKMPQLAAQKVSAGTLVQDGRVLYEAGQYSDAEIKLTEAIKLDPDNTAAYYYLNLIKQAKYARASAAHNTDTQERMEHVEKQWILPRPTVNLPVPNAYATNTLVYTGPGRQLIMDKLDRIHLDNFSTGDNGVPLSEVLRLLAEQAGARSRTQGH